MPTETTAQEWQARAIRETGGTTLNATFDFGVIYGTTGGFVTVEFNNFTGQPLPYPFSAASLKANLEAIPSVGVGGVKVSGAKGGPYRVEMVGDNAGQDVPPIYVDGSFLDEPQEVEVEVVNYGESNDYDADAIRLWADHAEAKSVKLRFLLLKADLIDLRLGNTVDAVDTRTGQVNELERKESQRVGNLERMLARCQEAIGREVNALATGSRRTYGGVMKAGRNAPSNYYVRRPR